MNTIQQYVPMSQAKAMLPDMVQNVRDSDDAIAITKNGVAEAVLIGMDKFQSLLETLEILADEKAMASVRKSVREAENGEWLDFEEVFEK